MFQKTESNFVHT